MVVVAMSNVHEILYDSRFYNCGFCIPQVETKINWLAIGKITTMLYDSHQRSEKMYRLIADHLSEGVGCSIQDFKYVIS